MQGDQAFGLPAPMSWHPERSARPGVQAARGAAGGSSWGGHRAPPSPGRPAAPPAAVAPCGASSPWAPRPPSAPCPHLWAGRGEARGPSCSSSPTPAPGSPRACANEEDVVVAISGRDTVHSDASEGVGHGGLQEEGLLPMGQHRVVHQRVVPGKLDDLIWEVLGGAEGAKGFAGALQGGGTKWGLALHSPQVPVSHQWHQLGDPCAMCIPCPGGDTAHAPGTTPTGSWDPPCARRGPGKPGGCRPWCRHRRLSPGKWSWWERGWEM